MQIADIPAKFALVWGEGAGSPYITTPIPDTTATPGRASFTLGFPPLNFTPRSSGGIPPFGEDFNGIFNQVTAWNQWQQAGGPVPYDATFQTAVGGYPKGAIVTSVTNSPLQYQSLVDNNVTNPDAGGGGWVTLRQRLSAATNFYVRTDGNDSNTGLNNTSTAGSGAFLTIQGAVNALQKLWDANLFVPTVNIGAGTFAGWSVSGPMVGQAGNPIVFNGAGGTTIINSTIAGLANAVFRYQNMSIGVTVGSAVGAVSGAQVYQGAGVTLTGCQNVAGFGLLNASQGGVFTIEQNFTIANPGNTPAVFQSQTSGVFQGTGITVTHTGTCAITTAYAAATLLGNMSVPGFTFTGTVTGKKFGVDNNSLIYTNTAGINYFPGNVAGTFATGGTYN